MGEIKDSHSNKGLKFFVSAGEESGELHGAELIKEIKSQKSPNQVSFWGLGGSAMENSGVQVLYKSSELSTIGFIDVIKKLSFFREVLNNSLDCVRRVNPDCVILIDYPGFNLTFAKNLRKFYEGKIFYYISPQLWAWNENRVYEIKKYVDRMLVVFPFEVEFYSKFGIEAVYVGHPLVKRIRNFLNENERKKNIFGEDKTITILPGSRKDEIYNHLAILLRTANQLSREFDLKVNISKSKGIEDSVFKKFEKEFNKFNLTGENSYNLILNSDLVLSKAGTSTVECALIGTPFALFYKTFRLNYYLLRPFVKVDKLGMVNILAKEDLVKEFVQKDFNTYNLVKEARRILSDIDYRNRMINNLAKIWNILGNEDASKNAARIITETIV